MEWRIFPKCLGYEVSENGDVRTTIKRNKYPIGKMLTPTKDRHGYYFIRLADEAGRSFNISLARVVAYSFLGEPLPDQTDINHIDHNKANNHYSNLEWCTHAENIKKRKQYEHQNHIKNPRPRRRTVYILCDADIPVIFDLARQGLTHDQIAQKYGVSRVAIGHVLRRETFKDVEVDLTLPRKNVASRKLAPSDVIEILRAYAYSEKTQKELAEQYGVSQFAINQIVSGYTHQDIDKPDFV